MPTKAAEGSGPGLPVDTFLANEAEEHRRAFDSFVTGLREPFAQVLAIWETSIRQGGKLLIFGNGGSAGDAQHLATELVVRYKANRAAIAAIALTADSSLLTAAANDFGFDSVFSRQIEGLGRTGDVAVGLSTSGRSANVLAGLREARARGLRTTGMIGANGDAMRGLCEAVIIVPSTVTARIQEMHLVAIHMLCKALEARLGLASGTPE